MSQRHRMVWTAVTLASVGWTGVVAAKQETRDPAPPATGDQATENRERQREQQERRDRATDAGQADERRQEWMRDRFQKGTDVLGMNVQTRDDEAAGEIKDVIVDTRRGDIAYAILAAGGWLGMGDSLFAVPWSSLRFDPEDDNLVINITKERLQAAEKFTEDKWPDFNDPNRLVTVYDYYGQWPYWERYTYYYWVDDRDPAADAMLDVEVARDADRTDADQTDADKTAGARPLQTRRLSEIIKRDVHNLENQDIGDVEDAMIDVQRGRLAYLVLETDRAWGFGDKLFALPIGAFQEGTGELDGKLVLNVSQDHFKNAPGFDQNNWPNVADRNWREINRRAFGVEDRDDGWDWFAWGDGDDDADRDRGGVYYTAEDRERGSGGWGEADDYRRLYDPAKATTIEGTILGVERKSPKEGMSEASVITVATNDNQRLTVHLGPAWFLDRQDAQLEDGQKVTVRGTRTQWDGQTVMIADRVEVDGRTLTLRHSDGRPVWNVWHGE